jgi:hypothetical protein
MDGTSVVALAASATRLAQARTYDAVQLALLKKALSLSSETALALLQAAGQSRPNPSHLGNNIDTWA